MKIHIGNHNRQSMFFDEEINDALSLTVLLSCNVLQRKPNFLNAFRVQFHNQFLWSFKFKLC